jgi:hypothetical protein
MSATLDAIICRSASVNECPDIRSNDATSAALIDCVVEAAVVVAGPVDGAPLAARPDAATTPPVTAAFITCRRVGLRFMPASLAQHILLDLPGKTRLNRRHMLPPDPAHPLHITSHCREAVCTKPSTREGARS